MSWFERWAAALVALWLAMLAWFLVSYLEQVRAAPQQTPKAAQRPRIFERLAAWGRTAKGWAWACIWGPIAFLGMAWRREPRETMPGEFDDGPDPQATPRPCPACAAPTIFAEAGGLCQVCAVTKAPAVEVEVEAIYIEVIVLRSGGTWERHSGWLKGSRISHAPIEVLDGDRVIYQTWNQIVGFRLADHRGMISGP